MASVAASGKNPIPFLTSMFLYHRDDSHDGDDGDSFPRHGPLQNQA